MFDLPKRKLIQKIFGTVLLGAAVVGSGFVVCWMLTVNEQKGLRIPPAGICLEGVKIGKPTTGVVRIQNDGAETVQIFRVTSSCGCTDAYVDRKTLRPGDVANLTVVLTARAGNAIGQIAELTLWTKGNVEEKWTVPVSVSSLEDVVVTPELLDFGIIDTDTLPTSRNVYIVYRSRSSLASAVFQWSCPVPWIKIVEKSRNLEREEIVCLISRCKEEFPANEF